MLRLIPAGLHRTGLIAAHRMRLVWWTLRRPVLNGTRVLAFDGEGRVLLVRHSYGSGRWMLPGGGIGRGEDPLAAAMRELAEETGCVLVDPLLLLELDEPLSGATNRVHVVTGLAAGAPRPDGREIVEARFHHPDLLPPELSRSLEQGLAGWITAAKAARRPR